MAMFAVKNNVDNAPVFVRLGHEGYWAADPRDMDQWARLYSAQGDKVTQSALAASMFGWSTPIAKVAKEYARNWSSTQFAVGAL